MGWGSSGNFESTTDKRHRTTDFVDDRQVNDELSIRVGEGAPEPAPLACPPSGGSSLNRTRNRSKISLNPARSRHRRLEHQAWLVLGGGPPDRPPTGMEMKNRAIIRLPDSIWK